MASGMPVRPETAEALMRAARIINRPQTLPETLHAVAQAAAEAVPGVAHAGVSMTRRSDDVEPRAATDPLVWLPSSVYGCHREPLRDGDEVVGTLMLCTTARTGLRPDDRQVVELFAVQAGIVLGRARREADLRAAMASRKVIGQAIGIVMQRFELNEERAFQFLSRASQTSNIKLRDIAREVVEATEEKNSPAPPS
jgi:GAF domain-containing protein